MNIEDIKRELTYQAALTYYDKFDIKKVKVLFSDLMNQGVYHNEFIEIEDLKVDCSFGDFIIVFEKALKAIDIAIPKAKNKYLEIITEYKILPIIINILNNKLGIIEASREILKTISDLRIDVEGLDVFKAIDSETDHLPIGNVRKHWNKDSLAKADAEIKEYEDGSRDEVRQACKKIISVSLKNKVTTGNSTYKAYLWDMGYELKERTLEAKVEFHKDRNDMFNCGYYTAFYSVISYLTQQAKAFDIDLKDLNLDDIDPDRDLIG